ncbi:MAG: polysaccharide biosynthesis/export family protein [Stenomitos frigidus ULC029]
MSQPLSQPNHSSVVDTQQRAYAMLLVLPLSCLLWGLSTTGFTSTAVSQEQSGTQPTQTTTPNDPRGQALPKQPAQEPRDRIDPGTPEKIDVRDLLKQPGQQPRRINFDPPEKSEAEKYSSYRLGPGDAIAVNISPRGKDLNFNATLDWEGKITIPLVGVLPLKDLTTEEAQEKIRSGLAEYIVNPQVGLVLATARPVRITITGEVVKPGFYALQDSRLPVALIEAGGTTRLADLRTVQVRRQSGSKELSEQSFDLYTPLLKGTAPPDLRLVDGDVILIAALAPNKLDDYNRKLTADVNVAQQEITIRVLDYSSGVSRLRIKNGSDFLDALTSIKPNLKDANLKKVSLVRFDHTKGRAVAIEINAKDTLKGDPLQNPTLENNDVIVIDRNLISKINHILTQITQPFKDGLGFLLFFDSAFNGVSSAFGSEGKSR